ncbi:hypothetical protein DL93DRAFT_404123 [Clavulina sp. PMI_390]|nr:hypothetical protein DL93DRAFT_404123 [Clavulina sp. PMI_390]
MSGDSTTSASSEAIQDSSKNDAIRLHQSLAPINTLTPVLLQNIFGLASSPKNVRAVRALAGVCSAWRDLVLNTPELFAHIGWRTPSPEPFRLWRLRSKNQPLSIKISGSVSSAILQSLNDTSMFPKTQSTLSEAERLAGRETRIELELALGRCEDLHIKVSEERGHTWALSLWLATQTKEESQETNDTSEPVSRLAGLHALKLEQRTSMQPERDVPVSLPPLPALQSVYLSHHTVKGLEEAPLLRTMICGLGFCAPWAPWATMLSRFGHLEHLRLVEAHMFPDFQRLRANSLAFPSLRTFELMGTREIGLLSDLSVRDGATRLVRLVKSIDAPHVESLGLRDIHIDGEEGPFWAAIVAQFPVVTSLTVIDTEFSKPDHAKYATLSLDPLSIGTKDGGAGSDSETGNTEKEQGSTLSVTFPNLTELRIHMQQAWFKEADEEMLHRLLSTRAACGSALQRLYIPGYLMEASYSSFLETLKTLGSGGGLQVRAP